MKIRIVCAVAVMGGAMWWINELSSELTAQVEEKQEELAELIILISDRLRFVEDLDAQRADETMDAVPDHYFAD